MRISDWSSDVCSSDLIRLQVAVLVGRDPGDVELDPAALWQGGVLRDGQRAALRLHPGRAHLRRQGAGPEGDIAEHARDRKSVVEGKSVSVRVVLGGRRNIKKKTQPTSLQHKIP